MAEETHDPIPYDRFQEVIVERNAVKRSLDELTAQHTALTAERGTLAEQLKAEQDKALASVAELSAKLATAEHDRLRVRVAVGAGLPLDLADRLQGKDEAELKADAARIAPLLKPLSPGVPLPAPAGSQPVKLDLDSMTPAQIREKRAELFKASQT